MAYSHNGKRFASGGADNTVIIWTSKVTAARAQGSEEHNHSTGSRMSWQGW